MKLTLKIWRQKAQTKGAMVDYQIDGGTDMSFLRMLDVVSKTYQQVATVI
jgi:succinate dehydrogenase/fumarate reductase-like Fe-S protein